MQCKALQYCFISMDCTVFIVVSDRASCLYVALCIHIQSTKWKKKLSGHYLNKKQKCWVIRMQHMPFKSYSDCRELLTVQVRRPLHQVLIMQSWTTGMKELSKCWACVLSFTRHVLFLLVHSTHERRFDLCLLSVFVHFCLNLDHNTWFSFAAYILLKRPHSVVFLFVFVLSVNSMFSSLWRRWLFYVVNYVDHSS